MFLTLALVAGILVAPSHGQYDDMEDDAFAAYLQSHDNAREIASQYSNTAGRACVKGAAVGALTGKGFQALCIGCAVGAASEVVSEMAFPRDPRDRSEK